MANEPLVHSPKTLKVSFPKFIINNVNEPFGMSSWTTSFSFQKVGFSLGNEILEISPKPLKSPLSAVNELNPKFF